MKQNKKWISLLLSLLLLFGTVSTALAADSVLASGSCGKNLKWSLNTSGTLTISGKGEMEDYYGYWDEQPPWEDYYYLVRKVVIKSGVTSLGEGAFTSYPNLKKVSIASTVINVNRNAFDSTPWSESRPDGMLYFGSAAAWYNGFLERGKTISIKEGTTSIGDYAFGRLENLSTIDLPESLEYIGKGAFSESGLQSIRIPKRVTEIEAGAFEFCWNLKKITVDAKNPAYTTDENGVLFNKDKTVLLYYPSASGKTTYTVPKTVKTIADNAFYGATKLKEIKLPDTLETIGDNVFSECYALKKINAPRALQSVGNFMLRQTPWLSTQPDGVIYFGKVAIGYAGEMPEKAKIKLKSGTKAVAGSAFGNQFRMSSITIPDSVQSIGESAFVDCSSLGSIRLPDGLKKIEPNTFSFCVQLKSITLPKTLVSIGDWAFAGCQRLKKVTLPDKLKTIGKSVFEADGLQTISIPASVKTIGRWAFRSDAITKITVSEKNKSFSSDARGVLFNKDKTVLLQYPIANKATSYTIPDSVKTIGFKAFANCGKLTTVSMPKSLERIEAMAFNLCESLEKISIPDRVTNIGQSAFSSCDKLQSVSFGKKVQVIADYAFVGCSKLKPVTIPVSVILVGIDAFSYCVRLKTLTVKGKATILADTEGLVPETTTLRGVAGSPAESYAKKYNIKFKAI